MVTFIIAFSGAYIALVIGEHIKHYLSRRRTEKQSGK